MTDRGQVDTSAAEVYDSFFVPALFGRFATSIADATEIDSSENVVDVACGSGALTRALRTRTNGRVVGVDLNPGMLAVARAHGGSIDYVEGDAEDLPFNDGEFDVATCQFGLMFLADPVKGVREMARVGQRGLVSVWDSIDASEGYAAMRALFSDELGPAAVDAIGAPFSMGRSGRLEEIVAAAGVFDASFTSVAGSARFASVDEWVTTEIRGWTLSESVTDERLAEVVAVGSDRLSRFTTDDGCVVPMCARVVRWSE